jgi:hypothetical protein
LNDLARRGEAASPSAFRDLAADYAALATQIDADAPSTGTADELSFWRLLAESVQLSRRAAVTNADAAEEEPRRHEYLARMMALNEETFRLEWEMNNILARYRGEAPPPRQTQCDGASFALVLSTAHDDLSVADSALQEALRDAMARRSVPAVADALRTAIRAYEGIAKRLQMQSNATRPVASFLRSGLEISKRMVTVRITGNRTALRALERRDYAALYSTIEAQGQRVDSVNDEWSAFVQEMNERFASCPQ